jgi:hypothetical protein
VHDPFDDDPAELTPVTVPSRKQEREGLPPGYRMRAEPHYVEQLTSRRTSRPVDEAARASMTEPEVPEIDPGDRERLRLQVLSRLGEGLGSIGSASALLAGDASPLARRTNIDLIRAEAWRAAWLVSGQSMLDGRTRVQTRPRPIGPLLERVRQGFAAECRLNDAEILLSSQDWNDLVAIDESALVTGITGAVIATFGVLGRLEGCSIRLSTGVDGGGLRIIEVTQEEISVPPGAAVRFFELAWLERPGGWVAGLGAALCRAVAQQHGGHAVLVTGDRRGTAIRMTLGHGL